MVKMPTREDAEKCLAIRRRSKLGSHSLPTEHDFCMMMLKKYEEWYTKTEGRIFNETAPFGSSRQVPQEILPPYQNEGQPND